ncbi:MAG TPA: hypothetical protein VGQ83_33545 [Polyangia bacterium]|jgi:hypothetical protein
MGFDDTLRDGPTGRATAPFDPDATLVEPGVPAPRFFDPTAPQAGAGPGEEPGDRTAVAPPPTCVSDERAGGRPRRLRARRATAAASADPAAGAKPPAPQAACPHCRQLIDARAVLCPCCLKPTGKRALNASLVAAIASAGVVALALYALWDWLGTAAPAAPP